MGDSPYCETRHLGGRTCRRATKTSWPGASPGWRPRSWRSWRSSGSAYEIAVQVIDLRQKHGLTQAQLAERCGVDQADISRIERGSSSQTRTLQRIAERDAILVRGAVQGRRASIRRTAMRPSDQRHSTPESSDAADDRKLRPVLAERFAAELAALRCALTASQAARHDDRYRLRCSPNVHVDPDTRSLVDLDEHVGTRSNRYAAYSSSVCSRMCRRMCGLRNSGSTRSILRPPNRADSSS